MFCGVVCCRYCINHRNVYFFQFVTESELAVLRGGIQLNYKISKRDAVLVLKIPFSVIFSTILVLFLECKINVNQSIDDAEFMQNSQVKWIIN